MKISKYIGDLLFEYECIVIPGLGGFITNDIPAKIQNDQRTFIPPSKKIVFNAFLKTNDGLLINKIAEAENISYADSKYKVESFVGKCFKALNEGKKINFQKVGIIFFNNEKNIQFEPDISQNYFAESYGMSSFISPPIRRETTRHKIEKTFIDRKPKPKQKIQTQSTEKSKPEQKRKPLSSPNVKRHRYIHINFVTLLIIVGMIFIGINNPAKVKSLYNNYSNFVPFFFQTPNEFLVENITIIPLNKIFSGASVQNKNAINTAEVVNNENIQKTENPKTNKTDTIIIFPIIEDASIIKEKSLTIIEKPSVIEEKPSEIKEKPVTKFEEHKVNAPEKAPKVVKIPIFKKYFIVAGSFKELVNAKKLIGILNEKGFDSEIIGQNKYGLYRVSFLGFNSLPEARKQLAVIKEDENESAWIFSK